MPERRPFLPLLAYSALAVIAFARGRTKPPARPKRNATAFHSERRQAPPSERESGRHAPAPWAIPARAWKNILWRTYAKINDNRLLLVAAGVVFYGLLALFPAIAAFVSLYGLFANPSAIDQQVSALSTVLPGGAVNIVHDELRRLAANRGASLSIGFIVGLLVALWSANAGTKAIIDALNVAYGETEKRSFLRLNLISLIYTLIGMAALMLAVGAVVVIPVVLGRIGLGSVAGTLVSILRWPILIALVLLGLAAVYRYLPCRPQPRWRWITAGSLFATVGWIAGSLLFSWYIANFGHYNATYGSLGAAIGMMTWMWISMIVVLVGAQLNAEIEQETGRGPSGRRTQALEESGAHTARGARRDSGAT
jgi:membrane protein